MLFRLIFGLICVILLVLMYNLMWVFVFGVICEVGFYNVDPNLLNSGHNVMWVPAFCAFGTFCKSEFLLMVDNAGEIGISSVSDNLRQKVASFWCKHEH